MSGNRLAVVDQASSVQLVRQPHVHYPSRVPDPPWAGVEGHTGHQVHQLRVVAAQAGRFLLHLGEMALAMMVGMMVFYVLVRAVLLPLGYRLSSTSDLYLIGMAVFMVVPMAAWMRFRGMAWRPIVEMSAAMVIPTILLIGAGWFGVVERSALIGLEHGLMLPAMVVAMLCRLDYYTGSHASHRCHTA